MNWKNVKLIFLRELRDQLRDRRTIFMVAVLPLLLYPALGLGMLQMALLFSEQPRTVVVLGAEYLPKQPELQLIVGDRIAPGWFNDPSDADKLKVITDLTLKQQGDQLSEEEKQRIRRLLAQAERFKEPVAERRKIKEQIARIQQKILELELKRSEAEAAGRKDEAAKIDQQMEQLAQQTMELNAKLPPIDAKIRKLFTESDMDVLLIIPKGFGERIERITEELRRGNLHIADENYYFGPTPITNRANEKSLIAYTRLQEALQNWEHKILELRLTAAHLPQAVAMPVNPDTVDVAQEDEIAAGLWSKLFPALLVLMTVTGAFYPAVDAVAGEKERGTMETLLILPARRSELVLGKFFTVGTFSVTTALLNLASMGFTGHYMISVAGQGALERLNGLALPSPLALLWLVVLLIPLAALFSSLCLAIAAFARSTKEGQYYLTPLLMVALGITIFCLSPGVELSIESDTSWFYSVLPIMGVALLLKSLLLDPHNTEVLVFAVPVLITSIAYSLLALWWAMEQFNREEVLFRESERFDLRLWIRHLLRDKEPTPSFSEAGVCFVLIMLLQFASIRFMGHVVKGGEHVLGFRMLQALLIQQLAIIASPALFMGILLTTSPRQTFRLHRPPLNMLALAVVLPFVLQPLVVELTAHIPFPPPPTEMKQVFALMGDSSLPLWLVLLAFAGAPAVCEELAFRGFILSGLCRSRHQWLAILLSAVAFGIMHMFPQQVFYATLLGVVLALLAIKSNSLFVAAVFHFLNNGLSVITSRLDWSWLDDSPLRMFLAFQDGSLRYRWPSLCICFILSFLLLRWLLKQPDEFQTRTSFPEEAEPRFSEDHSSLASVASAGSEENGV